MLEALAKIVGQEHVLTGEAAEPYLVDWRGRYRGKAQAVVRPGSTDEVAAVIRHCVEQGVPGVTIGG
ncbi:MAG TPA: hydroxyacid dehydrogenase, partial [Orrella sp.]